MVAPQLAAPLLFLQNSMLLTCTQIARKLLELA